MAKPPKDYDTDVPIHIIQSLARCMLPAIVDFYKSEDGRNEFVKWKNTSKSLVEEQDNIQKQ